MRATLALGLAACAALTLAGCAQSSTSGPSLVTTKSSTQLLMNEAVSRVPGYMVQGEKTFSDVSEACKTRNNEEGLIRLWRSSATIELQNNASVKSATIIADIAAGFAEQGWKANDFDGGTVELTKDSSPSTIRFTPKPLQSGLGGKLIVEARGACVTTDGPDSDEVKTLENRTD